MMESRHYGLTGPQVLLIHGGPGAPGYMATIAKVLEKSCRVVEPMQRRSSQEPLTVAKHVADLRELITSSTRLEKPAMVGHSWGAMLALAFAAKHSNDISCLVLIGCGTFDTVSRQHLERMRKDRLDDKFARHMQQIMANDSTPDERMKAMGGFYLKLDSYKLMPVKDDILSCDALGHDETWQDMIRLQTKGEFPQSFSSIDIPTIMLHGAYDPHPGKMIYESLRHYIPQLTYKEWPACGHYPWLEIEAREKFFTTLHEWLSQHA